MKIVKEVPTNIPKGCMVAMDVETFGQEQGKLHRPNGEFACLSICAENDPKTVYQIYDHNDVRKVLASARKGTWVFHNALYDLRQLERYAPNIDKTKPIWDTMLLEQSMNGGYYQYYSLADLSRRWLNEYMEKEVRKEFSVEHGVMSPQMQKYAAMDAFKTLQIALLQRKNYSDEFAFKAYVNIDEPCIWPVLDMPGIPVNVEAWKKMVDEFTVKAHAIEDELGINTYSGNQVMAAAHKAGIHLENNQAATLNSYADNPLIAKIIEAKMYRKAVSTYGLTWLEQNVEADGKVYASYHINGTETYRFSCSNPNMQQIPQRRLSVYRTLFIPSKGNIMSVWDIRQQEPCILAFESGDEELLRAIRSGEDLHLAVARAIFNEPKMKKEDPRRFIGKTINLGTSYGLTEYGLSTRLGIPEEKAAEFLRLYFQRFKDVFNYINRQRSFANQYGYVKAAGGHRVYINPYDNQHDNNAINAPIQTGAAEFTKIWMRKYWENCNNEGLTYALCASVHDEGVRDQPRAEEVHNDKANDSAFRFAAETLYKGVPFTYDAERGKSWACKSLETEMEVEDGE